MRVWLVRLSLFLAIVPVLSPQRNLSGEIEIRQALQKLETLGSVMMIGAHPDDENTALIAWLARGRHVRTSYLSLTRGEGGQNLIGSEQGDEMGVIRTQELLAARKIDGGEQFFTRAIDFGFTKSADETLKDKWPRDKVLGDVVWNIRRFRPDVIILRFTGTPRDAACQAATVTSAAETAPIATMRNVSRREGAVSSRSRSDGFTARQKAQVLTLADQRGFAQFKPRFQSRQMRHPLFTKTQIDGLR